MNPSYTLASVGTPNWGNSGQWGGTGYVRGNGNWYGHCSPAVINYAAGGLTIECRFKNTTTALATYISNGGWTNTNVAGNITVNMPGSLVSSPNNLLVAFVYAQNNASAYPAFGAVPTGWTAGSIDQNPATGSYSVGRYYYKYVTAADLTTSTVVFPFTVNANGGGGIIYQFGGIVNVSPVNKSAIVHSTTASATTVIPSLGETFHTGEIYFCFGWNSTAGLTVSSTSPTLTNTTLSNGASGTLGTAFAGTYSPSVAMGSETITWSAAAQNLGIGLTLNPTFTSEAGLIVLSQGNAVDTSISILPVGTVSGQFNNSTNFTGFISNGSPVLSVTGSTVGTSLTVTVVTGGTIAIGNTIVGTGLAAGTTILSQTSGTTGGAGVYVLSQAPTTNETNIVFACGTPGTVLTASSVTGYIALNVTFAGTGLTGGTQATAQTSGTTGSAGTYTVNHSQLVANNTAITWGGLQTLNPGNIVCDGSWHHLALVLNTTGTVLFIDGSSVASYTTSPATATGDTDITIGAQFNTFILQSGNFIDEVAIWNTAKYTANFTPSSSPYVGNETNLIHLYHLDGNWVDKCTNVGPDALVDMDQVWLFAEDPTNIGVTNNWFTSGNLLGGATTTLNVGATWESQWPGNYMGYGWYSTNIVVPASAHGVGGTLQLCSLWGDWCLWINGVQRINTWARKGDYKYTNLYSPATFHIDPSWLTSDGVTPNLIVVRIWGGSLSGQLRNSGLIAGTYLLTFTSIRPYLRPAGGTDSQDTPFECYDLSSAQQGTQFDLVVRPGATTTGASVFWQFHDLFANNIDSGTTTNVYQGVDGIWRAVVTVSSTTAQNVYLAGKVNVAWQILQAGSGTWTFQGQWLVSQNASVTDNVYANNFPAGTVSLFPLNFNNVGMYNIVTSANISNLVVNDPLTASQWSIQSNLQIGDVAWGDRTYTFSVVNTVLQGLNWIRTAVNARLATENPLVTFTIDAPATVYLGIDHRDAQLPWLSSWNCDNLNFSNRDATRLSALSPTVFDNTPYGSLQLIDFVNCTNGPSDVHPYVQGPFGNHGNDTKSPSVLAPTGTGNWLPVVTSYFGTNCLSVGYGWYGFRLGRGALVPGNTYLLRIQYPNYGQLQGVYVSAGQNNYVSGFRCGVSPTNIGGNTSPYDPWPISNQFEWYDLVIPLGCETWGQGGANDGDASNGIWIFILNTREGGTAAYQCEYATGAAVAQMRLYNIDSSHNPVINLPVGQPQRILTFEWEQYAYNDPGPMCAYANLMGYSHISPLSMIKWDANQSWGDPVAGYHNVNGPDQAGPNGTRAGFWETVQYVAGSNVAPVDPVPGLASTHARYVTATEAAGIGYMPRNEFDTGSIDYPGTDIAIGADGNAAKSDRYAPWVANILQPSLLSDFQNYINAQFGPYTSSPSLQGMVWRGRCDAIQISYSAFDAATYISATGTPDPGISGMSPAQVATWLYTTQGPPYFMWWHQQRQIFANHILTTLQTNIPDAVVLQYQWDSDKFSPGVEPDLFSSAFYGALAAASPKINAYINDAVARNAATWNTSTAAPASWQNPGSQGQAVIGGSPYIDNFINGTFFLSNPINSNRTEVNKNFQDWACLPSFYSGMEDWFLGAPISDYCCANLPGFVSYFTTGAGTAGYNAISYDETDLVNRELDYRASGTMYTPSAGFSMANEVAAWAQADVYALSVTGYTYGRGFLNDHRVFAQAFRALPAIPGILISGMPSNVAVRLYPTSDSMHIYIGIAYTGFSTSSFTLNIPWSRPDLGLVTDLVSGANVPAGIAGGIMTLNLTLNPMQLSALRADTGGGGGGGGEIMVFGVNARVTINADPSGVAGSTSYLASGLTGGNALLTSSAVLVKSPAGPGTVIGARLFNPNPERCWLLFYDTTSTITVTGGGATAPLDAIPIPATSYFEGLLSGDFGQQFINAIYVAVVQEPPGGFTSLNLATAVTPTVGITGTISFV